MVSGEVSDPETGTTIVAMIAAMMALVDISIVSVALNEIRASFVDAARSNRLDHDRLHDGQYRGHPDDRLVPAPKSAYRRYFAASALFVHRRQRLCAGSLGA